MGLNWASDNLKTREMKASMTDSSMLAICDSVICTANIKIALESISYIYQTYFGLRVVRGCITVLRQVFYKLLNNNQWSTPI